MTVFPFPGEAVEKNEVFSVTGFDWDRGTRAGELLVVPEGAAHPAEFPGVVYAPPVARSEARDGNGPVWLEAFAPGQTLRTRMQSAAECFGPRLWLELTPLRRLYTLPCPDGCFRVPEEAELAAHPARFCPEFVCQCAHWAQNGSVQVLLYDTEETIGMKLALAAAVGVAQVLGTF